MRFRTLVALSTVAALGAAPPPAAWAASPSPTVWGTSPTALLGSFFERANAVLRAADPMRDLESPRRAIRGLVAEVFDFREAASIALGPVWRSRTAQEQEEFIRLFADLLERGYIAVFSSKASMSGGGVTVQYLGESVSGESASVPTRVLTRTGEELPVEYRLVRHGGRWTVRDVIVDGVSLVANYRAQFTRILGTSTFPDLMVRMRNAPDAPIFAAAPRATATAAAATGTPATSSVEVAAPDPEPKLQPDTAASKSPGAAPASPGLLAAPSAVAAKEPAGTGGRSELAKAPATTAQPARTDPSKTDPARSAPARNGARADAAKPERPTPAGPVLVAKVDRQDSGTAPVAKPDRQGPAAASVAKPDRQGPAAAPVARPDRPAPAAVAKASAPPPAPTSTSPVPAPRYWVQLGAFKTLAAARLLASTLHPQTATISRGPGPGEGAEILNRVRIGPFAEHAQAAAKLRELDHRGYPGFIALTQD